MTSLDQFSSGAPPAVRRHPRDVRSRFARLALDGAGPTAILTALAELTRAGAALFAGPALRLRAASEPAPEGLPRGPRLPAAARWAAIRDYPLEVGGTSVPADLLPVGSDGVLAVLGPVAADDEAVADAVEVLAFELARERAVAEAERRLLGDFANRLLAGGLTGAEASRLAREAELLGSVVPDRGWVLVVEPDDGEWRDHRVEETLNDLVRPRLPDALAVVPPRSAAIVLPAALAPDLAAAERLATSVRAALSHGLASVSVGVGGLASSARELARSHAEAREALRLARLGGGRAQVVTSRRLGVLRLLLEIQPPQVLVGFADEELGSILRLRPSRAARLLETLDALVAERWSRRAAARRLGIHINSLNYRAEALQRVAGVSLDDPEARVALAVALQARSMLTAQEG